MAIIDKMELFIEPDSPVRQNGNTHALFITLYKHYFTFSTAASQALKEPEYLHMYVDRKNKKVAFKPCTQDNAAITFCVKTPTGLRRASIFSRSKVSLLREMAGLQNSEDNKGIRFPAEYIEKEETLLVDLSNLTSKPEVPS